MSATMSSVYRLSSPIALSRPPAGKRNRSARLSVEASREGGSQQVDRRRFLMDAAGAAVGATTLVASEPVQAMPGFKKDLKPVRNRKIPEEAYTTLPNGLKYYDVKLGDGLLAKEGERVAVHYDCKWRGVTFMTSRQGMGVTGGTPMGFDVGASGPGGTLKGLDLGVRGMRVGGLRKLKVPPELGYGEKGIGEVPGGATLDIDVELLSIKTSPMGYQVKIIEG